MGRHFTLEIERLKERLRRLCAAVQGAVRDAMTAVRNADAASAQGVIDGDGEIDRAEVEIEEECLKLFALYQPVAKDLRYLVAILKINNDLERIGDLAANIAGRAKNLSALEAEPLRAELEEMAEKTERMLSNSIQSLLDLNSPLAREVCRADEEVDRIHRFLFADVQREIKSDSSRVERGLLTISVSRQLERIADSATNIAEDVIYLIEGEIARHRRLGV